MGESTESMLWELAAFGCIEGIGRRTLRKVWRYHEEQGCRWEEFWVPSQTVLQHLSLNVKQVASIKKSHKEHIEQKLKAAQEQHSFRLLGTASEEYPPLLKEAADPPPVLFAKGGQLRWPPSLIPIAIVGTRQITPYGRQVTRLLATQLVELGCLIVSGLMYGVDSAAHLAALDSGGKTVAVLGYGFDHCYPPEHQPVLATLLDRGATLLTEYPPWKIPKKGNFPARNSIVAGMSAAVVVTEAAQESGSMITVQCALDEGRTICAVPGPITNPYSDGTKWLINEGAVLVSKGADVLEHIYKPVAAATFRMQRKNKKSPKKKPLLFTRTPTSAQGKMILQLLRDCPLTIDQLQQQQLSLSLDELAVEISFLEMDGLIENQAGWFNTKKIQ